MPRLNIKNMKKALFPALIIGTIAVMTCCSKQEQAPKTIKSQNETTSVWYTLGDSVISDTMITNIEVVSFDKQGLPLTRQTNNYSVGMASNGEFSRGIVTTAIASKYETIDERTRKETKKVEIGFYNQPSSREELVSIITYNTDGNEVRIEAFEGASTHAMSLTTKEWLDSKRMLKSKTTDDLGITTETVTNQWSDNKLSCTSIVYTRQYGIEKTDTLLAQYDQFGNNISELSDIEYDDQNNIIKSFSQKPSYYNTDITEHTQIKRKIDYWE